MFDKIFTKRLAAAGLVFALFPASAIALDATAVLQRASSAMGVGELKTLGYSTAGTGFTFGQAYVPGMPWPKITVHSRNRTINYETGSMRELITISRAEPKGGGGYPLSGQQTNDEFVSGAHAWNMAGGNPAARPRSVAERTHELWITPHGVLRAAIRNNATLEFKDAGGKSLAAVSFSDSGRFNATAYIDKDYLVERVESRFPDAVLGEVAAVTSYSGYADFSGVKLPTRIRQSIGGHPVLDVTLTGVELNSAAAIAAPDAVRSATERVTTDKVAEGVWFVAGGSHNSVAIEMKDHIVLMESPLGDYRAAPVIEAVKKLAPGKPIRYVVNSHNHFDHSGGLRAAVAEGATIVTQAGNKAYFAKAFATKAAISPDLLTKSGKKAKFMLVKDKATLTDGKRVIELHRITDSVHNDTFLMAYLPSEKLLIEADAFTPGAAGAPPPATPNANNVNLVQNIERLKMSVDRILPLHGRVVPVAELYAAIGKPAPR